MSSYHLFPEKATNWHIHSAQLDADHYGLEQIKRRLIEFLVVVRLHAIADEATSSSAIVAEEPIHKLDKIPSDRSNPDNALVHNGSIVSRQGATPIDPPRAPSPKRRKGVKGPILL